MTVAPGAGPREGIVGDGRQAAGPAGWGNLRPLGRGASAAAPGQWSDLLASISHELRTPLNAVIGFSDAMQQQLFGPIGNARYEEYVRHIRASGVELLAAAEDALAMTAVLAQQGRVPLDDVLLAPLVAGVVEDLSVQRGVRVGKLETDVPADLEVRGDNRVLPRAVRQLASIALARVAADSRVRISATAVHGLVELRVVAGRLAEGAPRLGEADLDPIRLQQGLGRRELAVWLAMALLELVDCRLMAETGDGALCLAVRLEQSIQGNFFGRGAA